MYNRQTSLLVIATRTTGTVIVEDGPRFARQLVVQEVGTVALIGRGILVLPIQDSFLVDYRYVETLREEMARTCRDHLGIEIPIEEDRSMIDDLGTMSEEAVEQFVAAREANPGYEGYRARGEAFRASQRPSAD